MLPAAREAVAEAMERWANPGSPHAEGRAAKAALEDARRRIAVALDWPGAVIFTSGASEALAIALGRGRAGPRFRSPLEHDAVARAAPDAAELDLRADGTVSLARVAGERPLVAIQHANNETGRIQPLAGIASELRGQGALLLADCAQTAGKLPLPDADFMAIAAHKFGGPPGVGALLVRDRGLLEAVGGQEQGYRPGTENLPYILGMATALEAGRKWLDEARRLRVRLEQALLAAGAEIVAAEAPRIPTIAAYRMPGVSAQAQLVRFDMAGIAVSAGSACASGSLKPSRVLAALGWPEPAAAEVIRVSFGRTTTESEVDRFAALWTDMASRRRAA